MSSSDATDCAADGGGGGGVSDLVDDNGFCVRYVSMAPELIAGTAVGAPCRVSRTVQIRDL